MPRKCGAIFPTFQEEAPTTTIDQEIALFDEHDLNKDDFLDREELSKWLSPGNLAISIFHFFFIRQQMTSTYSQRRKSC